MLQIGGVGATFSRMYVWACGAILTLLAAGCAWALWRGARFRGGSPTERLILSLAAWLVLAYAALTLAFLAGQTSSQGWITAAWLALGLATGWRHRALLGFRAPRSIGLSAAFALVMCLAMTALPRMVGGGMWGGDWGEHVERAWFWRGEIADGAFAFVGAIPTRPPGQNVLVGGLLALAEQLGGDHRSALVVSQVANACFAELAAVPVLWLARRARGGRHSSLDYATLLLLLTCGPFVAHLLFPWTRMLNAFFAVAGVGFYAAGLAKRDARRLAFGWCLVGCAMLVHYSAGPLAVAMGAHLLFLGARRAGRPLRTIAACAVMAALPLSAWVVFALGRYGAHATVASNTSVQDASALGPADNLRKVLFHLAYSIVPHPLHVPYSRFASELGQPSTLGFWRDYTFMSYAHTLLPGMGPGIAGIGLGGLLTVVLFLRQARSDLRRTSPRRDLALFWLTLFPLWYLVGCAVHGDLSIWGVAQVTLFPLQLLGLAYLAGRWRGLGPGLRVLLWWAVVLDVALVVFPHLAVLATSPGHGPWPFSRYARNEHDAVRGMNLHLLGDDLAGMSALLWLLWIAGTAFLLRGAWRSIVRRRRA